MQCGFVINGESKHDYSGWSVSSAGDVNGEPNTLRILALVEVCNKSSKLSFRVLSPEPVISITSMSTIIINASNIAALEKTGAGNRARVDGGGGIDTLKLEGSGLTLDLTKISISINIISDTINSFISY
jgi:hypothetical protein